MYWFNFEERCIFGTISLPKTSYPVLRLWERDSQKVFTLTPPHIRNLVLHPCSIFIGLHGTRLIYIVLLGTPLPYYIPSALCTNLCYFRLFFLYGWNIGPLFNLLENYQLSALI